MAARKKKAAKPLPEKVEGVVLAKLNRDAFERAYDRELKVCKATKDAPVDLPTKKTAIEQRVQMLVLWYRATVPNGELAGCSECGGDSDARLEECPFCGDSEFVDADGNVVEATEGQPEPELAPEATPEPEPEPAPQAAQEPPQAPEPEPEPTPQPEPEAAPAAEQGPASAKPKRKRKKKSTLAPEPAVAPEPEASPVEVVAPPAKSRRKRKLKTKGSPETAAVNAELDAAMQAAMDGDPDPAPEPSGNTGVIRIEDRGEPLSTLTVSDLDQSLQRCEAYKRDAANSLWQLGREVKDIQERRLWMLRTDDKGRRSYRTFKQFCVGDLGMSYMHAHRLIQVASAYTEEEMRAFGVSKCHLALKVPEDKRRALLQGAAEGNRAQLSDAVNALAGRERPKPPPKTGKALTVAMAQGRIEIPLLARPKGREGYPSAAEQRANPKPAKSMADDPYAVEILANDVRVFYTLVRGKDGGMILVVERARAKEDELFPDETAD